MRRLAPLTMLGALAAVLAPAAHAVDYTVDLSYPNADQSVLHAAGASTAASAPSTVRGASRRMDRGFQRPRAHVCHGP